MTPTVAALYVATVISATDGDTVKLRTPWVDTPFAIMSIRINGVDTPESRYPLAKCREELEAGKQATAFARAAMPPGTVIRFGLTGHDKYGRLLGPVILPDGADYGSALIGQGLARPYNGGKKSSWCP